MRPSKVRPWSRRSRVPFSGLTRHRAENWFSPVAIALACAVTIAAQSSAPDVGRPATPDEIRSLGAAIAPDGGGLPEGSGSVSAGRGVFALRCTKCHGDKAQGDIGPALVGGRGTLA